MTTHDQAPLRPRREGYRSPRRRKIEQRIPIVFVSSVLLGALVVRIGVELDRPRGEAEVTAYVESRGGEVLKINWYGSGGLNSPYIDVLFDGQQSRCSLRHLKDNPPVFKCDPAIDR